MINRKSEKHPEEKTHYSKKDMDDSIFLLRNMQIWRQWSDIFKVLKGKKDANLLYDQPIAWLVTIFFFKVKQMFSDIQKVQELITSKCVLQKV